MGAPACRSHRHDQSATAYPRGPQFTERSRVMRFHPPRDWPAAPFRGPIRSAVLTQRGVEDAADTSIGEIVVAAFTGDDNDVQTEQLSGSAVARNAQRKIQKLRPFARDSTSAAPEGPPKLIVDTTTAATLPLQAAFPQNQASPLSFARSLLESPTSAYATPSAASTKSVIAADEQSRQNEDLPDAVAAVLAARSQVPRGSNIQPSAPAECHLQF